MPDVFSVTAAWDKPSYATGDTITAKISGSDVQTTTATIGPVSIPIVAADGSTSTVAVPPTTVTVTSPQSVTIDITRPIVDSSAIPRKWVISADKLSISAVA